MLDILMSIFDYVPVCAFLVSSIILQRCLYNKMSKGAFALYSAGTISVFCAGFLKATYKILYYTGVCDWQALSDCFFPLQTLGFVLTASALVALLFFKQGNNVQYGIIPIGLILTEFVPPEKFNGTMIFVVLMVLGVLVMVASYIVMAIKIKKCFISIFLVISFIFILAMGYLSTKQEMSDWIKEIVNTIGQGSLLVSAILLKKYGLGNSEVNVSIIK